MEWEKRFWNYVEKGSDDECWNWTGTLNYAGYGIFHPIGTHQKRSHRISYELLVGPIPNGLVCCHRCDNRKCVNPNHIFLGTRIDNQNDMVKKKRFAFGNRIAQSKLTPEDIPVIIKRYEAGESQSSIAKDYPVGRAMIGNIVRRKSWIHS